MRYSEALQFYLEHFSKIVPQLVEAFFCRVVIFLPVSATVLTT